LVDGDVRRKEGKEEEEEEEAHYILYQKHIFSR
jgi:hypothetical protein